MTEKLPARIDQKIDMRCCAIDVPVVDNPFLIDHRIVRRDRHGIVPMTIEAWDSQIAVAQRIEQQAADALREFRDDDLREMGFDRGGIVYGLELVGS
ncbi:MULTISPECIES: hypothetical protein [unclassified Rhizobium]|uniref:hypothetical protein n=1 Tax=unclassified Rhizobium TaxID=2613769 RepID=UPI000B1CBCD0|nr:MULTISPECIES: hypothetical protein [unclassified Rhizobium]